MFEDPSSVKIGKYEIKNKIATGRIFWICLKLWSQGDIWFLLFKKIDFLSETFC